VKDLLLTMPNVDTLGEFITQAIVSNNRLFERRQERQSGWNSTPQIVQPMTPITTRNFMLD
jgi:hypothetical protein